MSFFVILLIILLLPVIFVFMVLNGVLFKFRRAFKAFNSADAYGGVKHQKHSQQTIDEAIDETLEYSDEDIIEAEFEEIDEENEK